jgi:hypothetical protein
LFDRQYKSFLFDDHGCLAALIGEEQNGADQGHEKNASGESRAARTGIDCLAYQAGENGGDFDLMFYVRTIAKLKLLTLGPQGFYRGIASTSNQKYSFYVY